MRYRAVHNAIYEGSRQVCVILPSNCTKAEAVRIAKLAAEAMNRASSADTGGDDGPTA